MSAIIFGAGERRHLKLNWTKMECRHGLTFMAFEQGKLVMKKYSGRVFCIELTPVFVEIAEGLRIRWILLANYPSTCAQLAWLGFEIGKGSSHESG